MSSIQSPVILPLSSSQMQVWLDQQCHPGSVHFNLGGAVFINGQLNVDLMERALVHVVAQNEALRLLPLTDGTQQLVDDWPGPLLLLDDLSNEADPQALIRDRWKQTFATPFVLDGILRPWSIELIKASETYYGMSAISHHLVMDGMSVSLLFGQMSQVYNQLLTNQVVSVIEHGNYQPFINESAKYEASKRYQQHADYWQSVMSSVPPTLFEAVGDTSTNAGLALAHNSAYSIELDEYQQLQNYAKNSQSTTYHLYMAALAIYFSRTLNKEEVVFGLPVLNRGGKRYKQTIGMFVVVVPLRVNVSQCQTAVQLLDQISLALRGAYRHAQYPLSKLGQDLDMIQQGKNRLFDVVLSFEVQDFNGQYGDTRLSRVKQVFSPQARHPLSVSICELQKHEPVEVILRTSADYFSMEQTQQIAQRVHYLMMQMVNTVDAQINQLPLLLEEERYELITSKHADVARHTDPQPFITLFEHQAALHPQAEAIRWQSETDTINTLDYNTLNEQANRLAHCLLAHGIKKDDIVAVVMPRQPQTIMAFLAIAKAGAAFVPLDCDAPSERLQQLIELSGAVICLVGHSSPPLKCQSVHIEGDNAPQYDLKHSAQNPKVAINANDLAYLLFTSGSTGTPKGVLMEHAPLTRRLAWLARTFNYTPKDLSFQSIQLTFDPAMIEIFLPLTHGASIALVPPGQLAPSDIGHHCELLGATSIIFVPTTLRYFNQHAKNHPNLKLRVAISGGELLHQNQALSFTEQTGARLFNLYGPTEACIFATAHCFDNKTSGDPVPIGEPVDDSQIYILDHHLQPLPSGAVGEIFIGGGALARGYLNSPQANQRFIDNPFVSGERIYHSGDSGFWDLNGQLQFVGRIDNQLKLRGQRIEPAEIETALVELPQVFAAAVKKVNEQLHAWVVIQPSTKNDIDANGLSEELVNEASVHLSLNKLLQAKLPAYMIPSGYTVIKAMPHQTSGKVDYKALKTPQINSLEQTIPVIKPRTDLQKLLLNLWHQVLDDKSLGVDCDFFEKGGDSLKALNLLSQVNSQMDQKLPLSALLQNRTVAALSASIIKRKQPMLVELSKHQMGEPIYLAASGNGDALRFAPLAQALGHDFNLQMLQPPVSGGYTSYDSISELAEYYASLIEQHQGDKPPILAGFSIGGITALETARHLISRGLPIGGLFLIDTAYPVWLLRRAPLWRFGSWLVKKLRLQELCINQRTLGSLFNDPGLNGQINALKSYSPAPFSLPTTLIISSGVSRWYRWFYRPWKVLLKEHLNEQHVPGFHGTLFAPEHVDELAKILRKYS